MPENILKNYFKLLHKYIPQPKKNNEFLEKIVCSLTEKSFEELTEHNKTENVEPNTIGNWLGGKAVSKLACKSDSW